MDKIIGWAEAPNSYIDNNEAKAASGTPSAIDSVAEQPEEQLISELNPVVNEDEYDVPEEELADSASEGELIASDGQVSKPNALEAQVIEAMNKLGFTYSVRNIGVYETKLRHNFDINSFELEEIKFLIEHAERHEALDYFNLVREAYSVNHRAKVSFNSLDPSPKCTFNECFTNNIDALIKFAKEKYNESLDSSDSSCEE